MVYALHLLFFKPKPQTGNVSLEKFCDNVFHTYRVNFVGHFNNRFDLLKQGKKEKKPSKGKADDHILWHTPSSPALPSEGMYALQ